MSDPLTSRALATASALLSAAAIGDRVIMREILDRTNAQPGAEEIVARLVHETAPIMGVTVEDILSPYRGRDVSHARFVVCYAASLLGMSSSYTARQLGIDHTSVIHGIRRAEETPRLREVAESVAARMGWEAAS